MTVKRCPQCGSTQTYLRIKSREIVCRQCMNIQKFEGGKDIHEDIKNWKTERTLKE